MHAEENVSLAEEREAHLARAAEAEANGDLAEAERLFRAALLLDARARNVADADAYTESAGDLFRIAPSPAGAVAGNPETAPPWTTAAPCGTDPQDPVRATTGKPCAGDPSGS
jgi:hypothetical protein